MNQLVNLQSIVENLVQAHSLKLSKISQQIKDAEQAKKDLYSETMLYSRDDFHAERDFIKSAKEYAWNNLIATTGLKEVMPSSDYKRFSQSVESSPPDFTLENILATFGPYISNPRESILRGLAEQFSRLDPAFKSHEKCKIGAKGLPKRIVVHIGEYDWMGTDKLVDILKPLFTLKGLRLSESDLRSKISDLSKGGEYEGLTFKRYKNGRCHVHFDKSTLQLINECLAEYYGDVLPDITEHTDKPKNNAVSKDLAFYPTPKAVIDLVFGREEPHGRILEPSCGNGNIIKELKKISRVKEIIGVEYDPQRANQARSETGCKIHTKNFLEMDPLETGLFDCVIMNPPFAGEHWKKHIEHAKKFLENRGLLVAILPASAQENDVLKGGVWYDLPLRSFKESGTNVCTGFFIYWGRNA